MNLSALQTFLAIIDTGNLNRAAERLNVTQSTVTARLNGLELELGQTLFMRRKSGAELTSAGFKFQRYAQLMSDLWRQARQETSLPSDIEAVFNLGCLFDLWPGLGRTLFEAIRVSHPRVALSTWPADQSDIERWLGSGLIDAAVCTTPVLRESWTAHELPGDRLVQVSSRPRELMRWDPAYIYVDFGEEFRRQHAAAYPDGDAATTVLGSAQWGLEHLMRCGGSAYLPERLVQEHIVAGRLHLVPDAAVFQRACYLVVNARAAEQWPWLDDRIAELRAA